MRGSNRIKKQAEALLQLVLGHIEAEQCLTAEQVASEGNRDLGFANACWTEEKETAFWASLFT